MANGSSQCHLLRQRLMKYSLGSQSIMVLSGLIGITTDSNANITALDIPVIENQTISKGGTGTLGENVTKQYLTQSSDTDDQLWINGGDAQDKMWIAGVYGARIGYEIPGGDTKVPSYLPVGFNINLYSVGFTKANNILYRTYFYIPGEGNLGDWNVDRPNGAIAIRNGDGEYGYLRVSWVAATSTMTFLSGEFDDTPAAVITVTAVPEPVEYAAALGLGALGLAYYRRRPGNKSRPKN